MDRGERIVEENIGSACNYIISGYFEYFKNSMYSYIPTTVDELEEIIYKSATRNLYFPSGDGCQLWAAPKEMKVVKKEFCKRLIRSYLSSNNEFLVIAKYKHWKESMGK